MDQTRSAASFVRKMEAPTGRRFCSMTKTPARLTWRSSREIRKRFSLRCGKRAGLPGAFILRRTARAADCIVRLTAEIIGKPSKADCQRKASGAWELRLRRAIRSGFILSWTPRKADSIAQTTAGRTGSKVRKTTGFGAGGGTL